MFFRRTGQILLLALLPTVCLGQQKAKTEDGKEVILNDDGTWAYSEIFTTKERGLVVPRVLEKTTPPYTEEAKAAKVEGLVLVRCIVRKSGRAEKCEILRDLPHGLAERFIAELENWRFEPGRLHGQPVDVEVALEVEFRLR